jgi:hypothetical protein
MNQVLNFEFKQEKPDPAGGKTDVLDEKVGRALPVTHNDSGKVSK